MLLCGNSTKRKQIFFPAEQYQSHLGGGLARVIRGFSDLEKGGRRECLGELCFCWLSLERLTQVYDYELAFTCAFCRRLLNPLVFIGFWFVFLSSDENLVLFPIKMIWKFPINIQINWVIQIPVFSTGSGSIL